MQQVAFLTQHGKVPLLTEALAALGWQIQAVSGFDTDLLGSFAGERPRFMTAAECALRKAALAAELSGSAIGIGSEGSFNAGPYGLGTLNQELLCCVNIDEGWAVTAVAQQLCSARSWQLTEAAMLQTILPTIPDGQLLLLKQGARLEKALTPAQALLCCEQWLARGAVTLEYDLRAHCSPERQQVIRLAADNLRQRLQQLCPRCHKPGFWPELPLAGLPCADCGQPTSQPRGLRACCRHCDYQQAFLQSSGFADPANCPQCNP